MFQHPKLSSVLPAFFAAQNNQHVGGVAVAPETSAAAQNLLGCTTELTATWWQQHQALHRRAGICYSPGGEAACARCGRPCKFGSGTCLPNGCISNVANICNCANALCCCKHITFLATACTGARQLYECHFKTKPTATITNFTNIYNCANAVCCCLLMHQHRRNSLQRRTPTHVRNCKTRSHQCKQMKLSMAVCPLWQIPQCNYLRLPQMPVCHR